jgi:hypothetical protein
VTDAGEMGPAFLGDELFDCFLKSVHVRRPGRPEGIAQSIVWYFHASLAMLAVTEQRPEGGLEATMTSLMKVPDFDPL